MVCRVERGSIIEGGDKWNSVIERLPDTTKPIRIAGTPLA